MGDQTWARPLQRLIVEKVDVTPIRSALLTDGAAALDRLAEFFGRWEAAQAGTARSRSESRP